MQMYIDYILQCFISYNMHNRIRPLAASSNLLHVKADWFCMVCKNVADVSSHLVLRGFSRSLAGFFKEFHLNLFLDPK